MTSLKRILYLFIFLSAVWGCGNNDIEPKNQVFNDGVSYELDKGAVIDYGRTDGATQGYSLNLYLMSPEISILGKNGVPDSISGKGHLILFEMYSSTAKELAIGKYEFDATASTKEKSFGPARAIFNANYQTKTGDEYQIVSGYVIVSKRDNRYIIDFDCMDNRGKRMNGYYKGEIAYYNME
ncbi:hypothetical protein [Dyadobacter sp. CY312]|uniref:hypothetical protein n=1 Tax=Dyadobacter sp. CY312 TaxID=2907303 RepID=UPI001F2FFCA6|nr:hypothetical protein [Dyadobacter sp. CY312]MCE7044135.1 hypothetical protein [Dyadobacter sp. CY312]